MKRSRRVGVALKARAPSLGSTAGVRIQSESAQAATSRVVPCLCLWLTAQHRAAVFCQDQPDQPGFWILRVGARLENQFLWMYSIPLDQESCLEASSAESDLKEGRDTIPTTYQFSNGPFFVFLIYRYCESLVDLRFLILLMV